MAKGNPNTRPPAAIKGEIIQEYLRDVAPLAELTPVDKSDTEKCKERVRMFFQFCDQNKRLPTVELLTVFLARSRVTLHNWENDPKCENGRLVKQAKQIINSLLTELSMKNEINSIYTIFLQKCDFGYTEPKPETVIELRQNQTYSPAPIDRQSIMQEFGEIIEVETATDSSLPPLPSITAEITESED